MEVAQQLLILLGGVINTLLISIISFLVGILVGLPLAFLRTYEKKLAFLVEIFEKIFRGIPELVLMLMLYFGLSFFLPFPFGSAFFTAIFVLGLRSGANQSQIFRGAIRGVGEEQMIAGRSVGLSRLQSIVRVMIPQVFIFSTPGLGSEYALLIKDSSYAFILGIPEIMRSAELIRWNTYDLVTPYVAAAFLYILLTFPISTWLDTWGSSRKKKLGL
ncbi:MAG: amino acid ABC transporter permease [Candidatus Hodarchaeota archaeon]